MLGGVTSASGGVVAVGEGTHIAVFSAATGASLFTYAGTGTFWGPPSIIGGTLYEGDMAGNLYALAVPGPPAKLAFVQGPSNAGAGAVITPAVKVAVEDASGNIETSDNATQVSLGIGTNPGGGTLSGGSAVTVASGIATFSGLSINTAGTGYTLTASSTPTYSAATSGAFNITSPQGTSFNISVNNASSATIATGGSASLSETGLPLSATGTVSFSSNGVGMCSISLSGVSNEPTSCSTSPALPAGSYVVTAAFSDTGGNFLDSTSSNSVALTVSAPVVPGPNNGYWLVGSDGGIFTFGSAQFYGSTGAIHLNQPIVGMAATPDGKGYWMVASDGGIFSFGSAQFYGSTGAIHLNQPIVGMAATPDGKGYWMVASDGGIFSFGSAQFYGSTGAIHLNQPIVGMAATPDGKGYWMVASDGGIFSFGDAAFYGSTGAIHLNQPIVGMAATPDGKGYWMVASDGGIFSFGDAPFFGSTGNIRLNSPIVGMTPTPDGQGYWFTAADGGVFTYGDAPFFGSLGGTGTDDVVGITR